jgi:outer membrane protein OmpA-like peptidoglycan-associated protein
MNLSPFFCRMLALILSISCFSKPASGHEQVALDTLPNYVVIGAFAKHKNAIRFTEYARKDLALNALYEINPNRNLYYVYCLTTSQVDQAITEARRLRSNTKLRDAWVFHGLLGEGKINARSIDINPVNNKEIQIEAKEEKKLAIGNAELNNVLTKEENTIEKEQTKIEDTSPEIKPDEEADISGKAFLFKLTRFVDQQEVKGEVDVIDPDKAKKIASYEGNRSVRVAPLKNKSGQITFATEVFGYRKMQRDVNFSSPLAEDITTDENGNTIIPFELVRLQKGDVAIMYNVYFYRDAAIMRPESRYEVNSLLEMLRENPKYKIKIHGHTNGNHSGKIIYRNKDSKEFFALTNSRDDYGSAKELSRARAEEIRDFLLSEGIAPNRATIKAWGGKQAIHDKLSARAQENLRVEIEILEDK